MGNQVVIVRHMLHVQAALQVVIVYLLDDVVGILPLSLFVLFADVRLDQMLLRGALLAATVAAQPLLVFQLLL